LRRPRRRLKPRRRLPGPRRHFLRPSRSQAHRLMGAPTPTARATAIAPCRSNRNYWSDCDPVRIRARRRGRR